MVSGAEGEELVEVRLLGLPVDVHRRAAEHNDGVVREFQLVSLDPDTAPARLIALSAELDHYSQFTAGPGAELEQALSDGRQSVDLCYEVPASARQAAVRLGEVLDDVDAYCEDGGMLSLAAPAEIRQYRRWFIGQFVDQIDGAEPVPWPAHEAGAGTS